MKKLFIVVLFFIANYNVKAQNLTITNNTTCNFDYTIWAANPATPCIVSYISFNLTIAGGTSITYNPGVLGIWLPPTLPKGGVIWMAVNVHDNISCMPIGSALVGTIGLPVCPGTWPQNASFTSCSGCGDGNIINVSWTVDALGNVTVTIS